MEKQQEQFVLSLLAYAVQRGVSAVQLCQLCNLDLDALKRKGGVAVTKKQLNDLWKNASHLSDDPLFGLHFGESLQLAALGVVGEIIKSSDTVGQSITIAASLTPTVTDLFEIQVSKSKTSFSVKLIPRQAQTDDFAFRQTADLLMVFTIHELNGLLLKKIKPDKVVYPYKVPNQKEYERVLRCEAIGKSNEWAIVFDNAYWDEPILTANYEVQTLFLQKINPGSSGKSTSESFHVIVMDYLLSNSYLGILTLADVAANFNLTTRSLQRRLQNESVTFQQITDSVRKSLALYYLESGKYQIKEISSILGYNELSAFSRAFKRWTGKAPMEYMQSSH